MKESAGDMALSHVKLKSVQISLRRFSLCTDAQLSRSCHFID